MKDKARILVVDDIPTNIELIERFFHNENYNIIKASNGFEALDRVYEKLPDLILLDVIMPIMDGFEVCKKLKSDPLTRLIPIIMITALDDSDSKIKGIELGVDDFISKPINLLELRARVSSLLKIKKYTDELENAEKIIFSLALAVEAKDPYTKGHCNRLSEFGIILGKHFNLSDEELKNLKRGAILHDIGKIAISDAVLLKNGPLSSSEMESMRMHPLIGEKICKPLKTLQPVLPIIRSHHERWNGSGYPDGLKENDVSLMVQIVALVDSYDAMTTDRPYRKAMTNKEVFNILESEMQNGLWNPVLLEEFKHLLYSKEKFEDIQSG